MSYTAAEKYADAVREVRMRKRVYERLVNVDSLSRKTAEERIEIMTEIAEDYRLLMKKEQLFDDPVQPTRAEKDRDNARTTPDDGPDRAGPAVATEPVNATAAAETDQR